MRLSFKNPNRAALGAIFAMLPLGIPPLGMAAEPDEPDSLANAPLIEQVRDATERFKDINAARAEGFVPGTPCVSGPDHGAMGVHFVRGDRITNLTLSADQPQALIYEPMAGGALRLVGVEFIVLAPLWNAAHPNGPPPNLNGHLLNLVGAPNRYGLPAFYEMHVWAWQHNPVGSFADWNTRVVCDQQPGV